ncbi:pyridoxamine 5'-phosphate oxidase family protein [Desulfobacterales bacterium HSG16]|nr:pyridoxamine 5'-phosphate oxidase family protein [Desulfobacterales bacterium HSG16]
MKQDRLITDLTEIEFIISQAKVCRLAMTDGEYPYIVPLCFGYRDGSLFFHSSNKGLKLDILRKNNKVCFEFDIIQEVRSNDKVCKWDMPYQSVVGLGHAFFIESPEEKKKALDIIVQQYGGEAPDKYSENAVARTCIIHVKVDHMTARRSK